MAGPIYRDPEVLESLGTSRVRPGSRMHPDGSLINPRTYMTPLIEELNLLQNPPQGMDNKTRYVRLARIWMPYLWRFTIPTHEILRDNDKLRTFIENLRAISNRGDFVGPQNRPYQILFPGEDWAYKGIRIAIGPYGGLIVGAVGFSEMFPPYPGYSLPVWATHDVESLPNPSREPRIS